MGRGRRNRRATPSSPDADRDFARAGKQRARILEERGRDLNADLTAYALARLLAQLAAANPSVAVLRSMAERFPVSDRRRPRPIGADTLDDIIRRVTRASLRVEIGPLPAVARAVLPDRTARAVSSTVFGAGAVVGISGGVLVLAHLFSKAAIPLVARCTERGILLGEDPASFDRRRALKRFRELVVAFCVHGEPSRAPRYMPRPDWPYWNAAELLRDSIEFFAVAHEYVHLLIDHGRLKPEGESEVDALAHEHAADTFGLMFAIVDAGPAGQTPMRMIGPMLFMHFVALAQRDGLLPRDGEHPAASERVENLLSVLRAVAKERGTPGRIAREARAVLETYPRTERLLTLAWGEVRHDLEGEQARASSPQVVADLLMDFLRVAGVTQELTYPPEWLPYIRATALRPQKQGRARMERDRRSRRGAPKPP